MNNINKTICFIGTIKCSYVKTQNKNFNKLPMTI